MPGVVSRAPGAVPREVSCARCAPAWPRPSWASRGCAWLVRASARGEWEPAPDFVHRISKILEGLRCARSRDELRPLWLPAGPSSVCTGPGALGPGRGLAPHGTEENVQSQLSHMKTVKLKN
ncbi:hypothetical protein NDU88_002751 [Pleurodeles waltl]|uniref:Uncharacterized protein n=1 Tax=Pleurodeles waltl TaxID=8319 RepID=A0AAV7MQC4_PLEWA|nr:hypothetical protein NDU88_002751 [Pleurodeles waltl]